MLKVQACKRCYKFTIQHQNFKIRCLQYFTEAGDTVLASSRSPSLKNCLFLESWILQGYHKILVFWSALDFKQLCKTLTLTWCCFTVHEICIPYKYQPRLSVPLHSRSANFSLLMMQFDFIQHCGIIITTLSNISVHVFWETLIILTFRKHQLVYRRSVWSRLCYTCIFAVYKIE